MNSQCPKDFIFITHNLCKRIHTFLLGSGSRWVVWCQKCQLVLNWCSTGALLVRNWCSFVAFFVRSEKMVPCEGERADPLQNRESISHDGRNRWDYRATRSGVVSRTIPADPRWAREAAHQCAPVDISGHQTTHRDPDPNKNV